MSDETNVRKERIERLLRDLRYEVERGMMERDIARAIEAAWLCVSRSFIR